jgi:hypothetical protein
VHLLTGGGRSQDTVRVDDIALRARPDVLYSLASGRPLLRSVEYDRAVLAALANVAANKNLDIDSWANQV